MDWIKIISISQMVIASLLIVSILLQQRGAGGSAITGGGGGASYYTKRGFEKILSVAIVFLAAFFIIVALASLWLTAH